MYVRPLPSDSISASLVLEEDDEEEEEEEPAAADGGIEGSILENTSLTVVSGSFLTRISELGGTREDCRLDEWKNGRDKVCDRVSAVRRRDCDRSGSIVYDCV